MGYDGLQIIIDALYPVFATSYCLMGEKSEVEFYHKKSNFPKYWSRARKIHGTSEGGRALLHLQNVPERQKQSGDI